MKLIAKRHRWLWVVGAIAAVGCVVAAGLVYMAWLGTQSAEAPVVKNSSAANEPKAEKAIFGEFAEVPKKIVIESLDIDASILSVGLTSEGAMEAPSTLSEVGWYNKSALAGQTSNFSVLLDGHYGSSWNQGVFHTLHQIKDGAEIVLVGQNESRATYKVVEIERRKLEEVDMRKAFYKYPDSDQSLTIITCEGEYDSARETYNDRVVVYAVRVS